MYQEHFGLDRPPFKITPDTSLFFEGNKRGAALEALVYAINSGEGIIKVVGEVGSGKTMLCRMLELRLSKGVDVVYIANPSLSPDNILHVIAHELGLDVSSDSSKLDVMQKLQTYLLNKHVDNRQVVLFVEEAQSMPVETLEEIRLLSNLETEHSKLLQMVLFGQPELDEKLAQPHIRQLKERITHCFYLDPFAPRDTLEYLNFRLRSVGYRGPDVFNQKTANTVEKYSSGLTRRINILADKALMASYSEGGHAVTAKHVKVAAKDSDFGKNFNARPWLISSAVAVALVVAVWVGTLIPGSGNVNNTGHELVNIQPAADKRPADAVMGEETAANMPVERAMAINVNKQQVVEPGLAAGVKQELAAGVEPEPASAIEANQVVAAEDVIEAEPEMMLAAVTQTSTGLLQQRLLDTEKWFSEVANNHYSIQLFMTRMNDVAAVEEFLLNAPETLDFAKIYIYETVINGRELYSVLYGDFASRQIARSKLESLPAELQASQPFLRRVSTFRKASVRNNA